VEIAGPQQLRFDEFIRLGLDARHDPREVIADPHARYFGTELGEEASLGQPLVTRPDRGLSPDGPRSSPAHAHAAARLHATPLLPQGYLIASGLRKHWLGGCSETSPEPRTAVMHGCRFSGSRAPRSNHEAKNLDGFGLRRNGLVDDHRPSERTDLPSGPDR